MCNAAPVRKQTLNFGAGGTVPTRRPRSVRRTTSIDVHWPEGRDQPSVFEGRARDAATLADGALEIRDSQTISGRATLQREIVEIEAASGDGSVSALRGLRAGGQLRAKLRELFPARSVAESSLYLLLDDLAGATLVSSWGWFAWDGYNAGLANTIRNAEISGTGGSMRGVCIGLREGSSALDERGFPIMGEQRSRRVGSLINPADPEGWHDFPARSGPAMRRARWIDVFGDGDELRVEAGFQDSANRSDGGREAIHEYRVRLTIESKTGIVRDVRATPVILPHGECPSAILNIGRIRGLPLERLRDEVPVLLAKEAGCTHLNDVLRALSGVPHLAKLLLG